MPALVRGARWVWWLFLAACVALFILSRLPGVLILWAVGGSMDASRWLHERTDPALEWIWKICPANDNNPATGSK
jgi:hypothetical protein